MGGRFICTPMANVWQMYDNVWQISNQYFKAVILQLKRMKKRRKNVAFHIWALHLFLWRSISTELRGRVAWLLPVSSGLIKWNSFGWTSLKSWTSCLSCFSLRQSVSFPFCFLRTQQMVVLEEEEWSSAGHQGKDISFPWGLRLLLTCLQLQWPGVCFLGMTEHLLLRSLATFICWLGPSPSSYRPCPLKSDLDPHPSANLNNIPLKKCLGKPSICFQVWGPLRKALSTARLQKEADCKSQGFSLPCSIWSSTWPTHTHSQELDSWVFEGLTITIS